MRIGRCRTANRAPPISTVARIRARRRRRIFSRFACAASRSSSRELRAWVAIDPQPALGDGPAQRDSVRRQRYLRDLAPCLPAMARPSIRATRTESRCAAGLPTAPRRRRAARQDANHALRFLRPGAHAQSPRFPATPREAVRRARRLRSPPEWSRSPSAARLSAAYFVPRRFAASAASSRVSACCPSKALCLFRALARYGRILHADRRRYEGALFARLRRRLRRGPAIAPPSSASRALRARAPLAAIDRLRAAGIVDRGTRSARRLGAASRLPRASSISTRAPARIALDTRSSASGSAPELAALIRERAGSSRRKNTRAARAHVEQMRGEISSLFWDYPASSPLPPVPPRPASPPPATPPPTRLDCPRRPRDFSVRSPWRAHRSASNSPRRGDATTRWSRSPRNSNRCSAPGLTHAHPRRCALQLRSASRLRGVDPMPAPRPAAPVTPPFSRPIAQRTCAVPWRDLRPRSLPNGPSAPAYKRSRSSGVWTRTTIWKKGRSWFARIRSSISRPGHQNADGVRYRIFDPSAGILRCFACHSTGPVTLCPTKPSSPPNSAYGVNHVTDPAAAHVRDPAHVKPRNPGKFTAARSIDSAAIAIASPPPPTKLPISPTRGMPATNPSCSLPANASGRAPAS